MSLLRARLNRVARHGRRYPEAQSAAAFGTHSKNCEIFATLCIYLNRATVPDRFSAVMSPNHNKWGSQKRRGGLMHQSTWVVLLLLMFGEIAILAFGGFILWLAGEFGDAPKWTRLRSLRKRRRAQ